MLLVAALGAMVASGLVVRARSRRSAGTTLARVAVQPVAPPGVTGPVASSLGVGAPPEADAGPAWTGVRTLHGDPQRTHRAAGRAPLSMPDVVWSVDVGGPVEAQVVTSPDARTLYVASLGGALTALDRTDGHARWSLDLGDRAYATPSVTADGTIVTGSDAKKVVAVSPEGKVRWSLDAEDEVDTGTALTPDGTVIFAAGRHVQAVFPGGALRFRFAAKRKVFTAPALGEGGRVFFGSQDHHAYALTPQGGPVWSVDLDGDVDGGPVVGDDGTVTFGTDRGEVVRLAQTDGHVVWRTPVGGFVRGALSLARNGDVLAGVYGPAPRMVRVRGADGALVGAFGIQGTGAPEFGVRGGALEDEAGTMLFGAQDDAVVAVDATGRLRWRFTTGADVDAPVTLLDGGEVVVASDDGKVTLLRGK